MDPELQRILNTTDSRVIRDWLRNTSLENVEAYVGEISADNVFRRIAVAERERRYFEALNKPHWTTTPTFWVALLASIAAVAAAVISWLAWQHPH